MLESATVFVLPVFLFATNLIGEISVQFSSFAQSCLTLRPQESQHARPPCPSPTHRVYSNSCPSSRWCHPAISSSVIPFSSCPQYLPASESFPLHMRWPKYQSFSFSISPSNEHPGLISFRMDWLDLLPVLRVCNWPLVGSLFPSYSVTSKSALHPGLRVIIVIF